MRSLKEKGPWKTKERKIETCNEIVLFKFATYCSHKKPRLIQMHIANEFWKIYIVC